MAVNGMLISPVKECIQRPTLNPAMGTTQNNVVQAGSQVPRRVERASRVAWTRLPRISPEASVDKRYAIILQPLAMFALLLSLKHPDP